MKIKSKYVFLLECVIVKTSDDQILNPALRRIWAQIGSARYCENLSRLFWTWLCRIYVLKIRKIRFVPLSTSGRPCVKSASHASVTRYGPPKHCRDTRSISHLKSRGYQRPESLVEEE